MRPPLSFSARAVLVLAALTLAYGVIVWSFALAYPTDGVGLSMEQGGLLVNTAPAGGPLQRGDRIIAVNGRPIAQDLAIPGSWQAFLAGADGALYTVERGTGRETLAVSWTTGGHWRITAEMASTTVVAFSFLACGVLIVLSRARHPAAPALGLALCAESLNLVNNLWLVTGTPLVLSIFWLFHLLDLFSFALTFAAVVHAALIFPAPTPLYERFPRLAYLGYLINLPLAMGGSIAAVVGDLPQVSSLVFRIFYPLSGIELFFAIGLLIHTYRTSRRPGVRNQIRWLMWGIIIGPLPWLLLCNLPSVLISEPLVPLTITALPLIAIPLSILFSATRRGLIVVDTLIHRTAVYVVMVIALVGLYWLGTAMVLDKLGDTFIGVATPLLTTVLVAVIAVAAVPLHRRVGRLFERLMYRRWADLQQVFREVGERLSTTLHFETLVALLTEEILERLQLTQAMLLLHQEDGTLRAWGHRNSELPFGWRLLAEMATRRRPLVVSRDRLHDILLGELAASGWELVLPLRSGGRLVGLYLLGPWRSGDLFSRQEVETLTVLSHQVAATLENARLYSQIEHYTEHLEEVVQARTAELASERDRLDVILQHMADGLLVTDPAGRVVLVNPSLAALVRRPADALVGRPAAPALNLPVLEGLLAQALAQGGQVATADLELDGATLRAAAAALRDGSAVVTVLRDVTHEREVDRMKTEFVSTVSHELRTPLTSVLGFAKLISRTVEKDLLPSIPATDPKGRRAAQRVQENLEIIVSEGERLTRLINDVLDIARMEAGRVEWHDRAVDLAALIIRAVESVHGTAIEKALPIRVEVTPGILTVYADPDRIIQVLTNLLSNAIKFTEQGEVSVTACPLAPGEEAHGWSAPAGSPGGALVAVRDTGIGIPAEAMPRLFQRFQQIGDTLRDKPRGTGLGLAICREIVTHYGGVIWAESTVGVGSTFSFTLPLAAPAAQVPISAGAAFRAEELPAAPGATVLIVDDEAPIRSLLRQALLEGGYNVLEAAEGTTAITIARQRRPDLLILDLQMPGLSGQDVAQLLKADVTTADIPILILSVEDREHTAGLGAAAHLTKPVRMETLLQKVAELLSGRGMGEPGGRPQ